MPADNPLTAAELRAIGERVRRYDAMVELKTLTAEDRAVLLAALERLIANQVCQSSMCASDWWFGGKLYQSKDAAIDALLGQGGGE